MAKKLPEPPGSFGFLGLGAEEGISFLKSPIDFAEQRMKKHGNARMIKSKLLRKPCAFLLGYPELKEMLEDKEGRFARGDSLFSLIEALFGKGVMLLDGADGERVRGLLYQEMASEVLVEHHLSMMTSLFSDCLLLWEAAYELRLEKPIPGGERALDWMMEYLHVHRRTKEAGDGFAAPLPGLRECARALVEDFNAAEGGSISFYEQCKHFCNTANLLMWFGTVDMNDDRLKSLTQGLKDHYRAAMSVPVASLGGGFKRGLQAKEFLLTFIRKRISHCRQRAEELERGSDEGALLLENSLLYRVVHSRLPSGETWASDEELETQVLWMSSNVIPKTVASLITSVIMATHGQDVWEELLDEQASVSSGNIERSEDQLKESLGKMPVLSAVIEETLRLYPPFVTFCKATTLDIPDFFGYRLPKDWQCFYLSGIANKDTGVYSHADQFDHKRWTDRDDAPSTPKCPMHLSFGYGSRKCLGRGWARLITKLMASMVLQDFSFSLVKDQDLTFKCLPVLKPRSGLRIHALCRRLN